MNKREIQVLLSPLGKRLCNVRKQMHLPRQEIMEILKKDEMKRFYCREMVGWTRGELAELSFYLADCGVVRRGYEHTTYWRIENGMGCTVESLLCYAWMLGVESTIFR
jgi:hypothetical protein